MNKMTARTVGLSLLLSSAAPLALVSAPALAQSSGQGESATEYTTIVITARKREESLLEAPLAVTAFSEAQIQEAGFDGLEDISLQSTGFQFSNQGGQQPGRYNSQLRFRGMSTSQFSPTFATGAVFIDGIYVLNGATTLGLMDVERVEVIKGPQSAYFGRNTFGGAVNFVTRAPSLSEFRAKVDAQISSRQSIDVSAIIETPLIQDKLSVGIAARLYDKRGHYVATDGGRLGNEQTWSLNGVINFQPTEQLSIKLRGSYSRDNDGAPVAGFVSGDLNDSCTGTTFTTGTGDTASPTNYICGELPGPGTVNTLTGQNIFSTNTTIFLEPPGATNPIGANFFADAVASQPTIAGLPSISDVGLKRKTQRYSLAATYDFENEISLDFIAAYNKQDANWIRDFDLSDNLGWFSNDPQGIKDYSFEARVTSGQDQRLRWLIGANYYNQTFTSSGSGGLAATYCFAGAGQPLNFDACTFAANFPNNFNQADESEVKGLFGSLDFDITDQITLIAEGRYQDDTLTKGGTITAAGLSGDASSLDSKAFLPRIILRYQPTPSTNLYASFAKGILQGDINTEYLNADARERAQYEAQIPNIGESTSEEKLDAWEIGWKQSLMGGRASFNLSAYYYEWSGIKGRSSASVNETCDAAKFGQTGCNPADGIVLGDPAQFRPVVGGPLQPFFNARNVLTEGDAKLYGLELEASAFLTDNWTAGLNVTWAKNEYKDYEFNFVQPFAGFSQMRGNQQPRFPEWSGNATSTYTHELNNDWDMFVRGDVIYFGEAFVDESNLAYTADYFLVNAKFGVEREGLRLEVFVKNLFDEDAYSAGSRWTDFSRPTNFATLTLFQGVAVSAQDKREFGVRAIMDF